MAKIEVDRTNIAEVRLVSATLIDRLEELARMTEKYPVVFTFADQRWVFESRGDIVELIEDLSSGIEKFEAAAA